MGEAAKKWMAAVEDPSRLVVENNRLRDDLGERDEYIARLEMRYENDANGYAEREKQLISAIERLKAELAAAPHWVPVAEFSPAHGTMYYVCGNRWSRNYDEMFEAIYSEHPEEYAWTNYKYEVRVTHVLVGINPPVSNEDPRGDGDLLPESERLDNLTRECMRDEFDKMIEITRKMDEPPVCKHEKTRTVLGTPYDSHSIECVDCGCDVTHSEPVKSRKFGNCGRKNCRGVSHQVNHGYCRECQSAIDEITDSLTVLSAKPKRDLIVAASPNGLWNVWEQQARGNYELVAGPFNRNELAHAAADEIRAEEGTSNYLAGDASDIDRAMENNCKAFHGTGMVDLSREPCCTEQIEFRSCNGSGLKVVDLSMLPSDDGIECQRKMMRLLSGNHTLQDSIRERLLQPFLGSEAEKLGAKLYQLRSGERWEYLSLLSKWETAKTPVWYRGVKYRLAKGE